MKSFRENRGHKDKLTVPAGFLGNGLSQLGYTPLVLAALPRVYLGWVESILWLVLSTIYALQLYVWINTRQSCV